MICRHVNYFCGYVTERKYERTISNHVRSTAVSQFRIASHAIGNTKVTLSGGGRCAVRLVQRYGSGDRLENFVHVDGRFGRRLHEQQSVFVGVRLHLVREDTSLGPAGTQQIRLVPGQSDHDAGGRLLFELFHPFDGSTICVPIGNVVHHDSGVSASVVHRSQTVVTFLAGRVPDFELDDRTVDEHVLGEIRGTDGALLMFVEHALDESEHQTGFADRRFAQNDQLEHVRPARSLSDGPLNFHSSTDHSGMVFSEKKYDSDRN